MVEVPISEVAKKVQLIDEEQYIILDAEGNQVPYQITYDDKLLFQVNVKADAEAHLTTWKTGEATEESFIELVKKYSEDSSATTGFPAAMASATSG